ncbi:hypothetical protein N7507_004046 [Penicillium longicatenatum]|nr:hypothetical protein N7507_004046 [Penicillium longicatenatum]
MKAYPEETSKQDHNPYIADQENDGYITPEHQNRDARIVAPITVGPENSSWPTLEDCCKDESDTNQRNKRNTDKDQNAKMLKNPTVEK